MRGKEFCLDSFLHSWIVSSQEETAHCSTSLEEFSALILAISFINFTLGNVVVIMTEVVTGTPHVALVSCEPACHLSL